ncbi:MFS transporter [Marinifilum caeruleilacunae]|uniref:MFS transporter n=1 Tax=Marinifilum caeruleilacunae TaxID=2499076 RepID=A0ABX1WQW9_9BACT|nr:MFS transporter [Marinifilum caeruleilacunae]NOU58485.1 MFS transporter [Marinifilum caeruleilacunae]
MLNGITNYFKALPPAETIREGEEVKGVYTRLRWSVFISATIGYSLFYVCRLSLNVVKKPLVDAGVLNESELGMVGSALFFTYAIGKLVNGFLADRSNIRRFMAAGLLFTALINLILGFKTSFFLFTLLWGMSGWFQSMGAAPSVVSLSRWFSNRERGTYYGIWSASHGLGKAITYIGVAFIVSFSGWQWGFWGAGLIGLAGAIMLALFLHDSPESKGLPSIADYKNDHAATGAKDKSVGSLQKDVLKNPAIWILAISSALMYVSRYGIESWGIYYLEVQKGYTTLKASSIVSVSAVSGIVGTMIAGFISDKLFKGSRNIPVLVAGILNVCSISLFLFYPDGHPWMDTFSMLLFGFAIGILITFIGGLMAVDIASKKASGAALGLVGIASYIGAGIQDMASGILIESSHYTSASGVEIYDFSTVKFLWLGAALLSMLLVLLVWNAKVQE